MTTTTTLIERITCSANGQVRDAELRDDGCTTLEGEPMESIWFAGDETGEFKQQMQSGAKYIRQQWAKIKTLEVK